MSLFRENIDAMVGYQPGEQPAAGEKVIKLNTNENPYPPSPVVADVLRDFDVDLLRRYPNPYAQQFRRAVGEVLGFEADWILPGNGSDDLLTMLMRSIAGPESPVAYPMPTYVLYRTLAKIQDAEVIEVPFDDDYNLPIDELARANAALTLIANPNSPSGTQATCEQLADLASRLTGVLVIDEAYVDFADSNALELVRLHENVIVLRTLSKSYSLAGLRLGFGVANPALLEGLAKVKDSYNVSALACAIGVAAFSDQAHKNANVERIDRYRQRLSMELKSLDFRVWPSQANFILVRPADGQAQRLYEALKARGILVRYFNQPHLDDKLRITIGSKEQNVALVEALKEMLA